jgi:ABC-type multidrug transport system fused ATPase/permease subunit
MSSTTVQNQTLSSIIDFINKLKTLSFRDASALCCQKVIDVANKCIFNNCISWKEFGTILNDLNTVYKNDDLGPLITAVLGMLEVYFGFKGAAAQGNNFTTSLPIFWAMFGAFAGVVVGSLAGAYAGLQTINVAVKTSFWGGKNSVFRASYYVGYGGNSIVGSLLGFLEASWVVSYLVLATALVAVPYFILAELGNFLNSAFQQASNKVEMTYRLLGHGFLMAFGSWMSAWALKLSADRLIGWFDKQNTDANSANNKVTNDVALAFDFVNHSLITFAYNALAWVIAGSSWGYVYYQLTDTTLKN